MGGWLKPDATCAAPFVAEMPISPLAALVPSDAVIPAVVGVAVATLPMVRPPPSG